jgi:hypothetical protein
MSLVIGADPRSTRRARRGQAIPVPGRLLRRDRAACAAGPDRVRAHLVALSCQLRGQLPGGLGGPLQRRHRIAPLLRLHQGQQRRHQPRILLLRPPSVPAGRRARPGTSAPEASSAAPSDTLASRTPAAWAIIRIPPCPSARACAPISRRRRSSRCGTNSAVIPASDSAVTSMHPYSGTPQYHGNPTSYPPATPSARNSSHVRLPTARSGARFAPARSALAAWPGMRTGTSGRCLPAALR